MSFRDQSTLSMLATRERQHRERVPLLSRYDARVLPIGVVYGGNASGKTNFFKALNFVKRLVTKGTSPEGLISVDPFRLDSGGGSRPSTFVIGLLVNEVVYELSFSITKDTVLKERLAEVTKTSSRLLYDRIQGQPAYFDPADRRDEALKYAFQGTRDNQLFLTNCVHQKIEKYKPVYDWFNSLSMVAPDTRFSRLTNVMHEDTPLYSAINKILPLLDTGIAHVGGEMAPLESLSLPEAVIAQLNEEVKEGLTAVITQEGPGSVFELYEIARVSGELVAKKLYTYHVKDDGSQAKFEFRQESDGSQRVINLLPAFLEASVAGSRKVFVIDEVDRSLHTLLTRRLIEAYLAACSEASRAQLLLTTHDVLLMDQEMLRRDEMWVTERDASGASRLFSFSEYKDVRYDKDIRKSYLQGRLGGIPRLLLTALPSSSPRGEGGVPHR